MIARQYESLQITQTQLYRSSVQRFSSSQQLEKDSDSNSSTHVTSKDGLILSDSCVKVGKLSQPFLKLIGMCVVLAGRWVCG